MRLFERLSKRLSCSLANQLLFTYLLVLTIALALVSFWALFLIKTESINDLKNALEVEALNLGVEINNDLLLDSAQARARIKAAVDRHASKLGVSITVVDNVGHVVVDSGVKKQKEGENISNQPEIRDALAGITAMYKRSSYSTNTDWLYVAYPVRALGETKGVIRVGFQLTKINQRLNKDMSIFLQLILITAVVTILISLWLARRVTRPIREMSALAKEIAKSGDVSAFVPVERRDEIGELGLSFNQMIGRLGEQERLRQEFIANASHELKTPTMAIGAVVEALQAGAVCDPQLREQFLTSLEKLVERQANLISDLLDITQLDAGTQIGWHEKVNLAQVVADAVEQIRPQAQKKEIDIAIANNIAGSTISGNSIQLQRALVNLLTNAVNFTPPNGNISISTRFQEKINVEVIISDSGTGIDPVDLPHIFNRFYRGDKARTRVGGGTGLGLAITREIVARHHGVVSVESTLGTGSTFVVRLPTMPNGHKE